MNFIKYKNNSIIGLPGEKYYNTEIDIRGLTVRLIDMLTITSPHFCFSLSIALSYLSCRKRTLNLLSATKTEEPARNAKSQRYFYLLFTTRPAGNQTRDTAAFE